MAGQEPQQQRRARPADSGSQTDSSDRAERKHQLDEDVDALLDQIDDVLEENAEEFVRSFVQKGGQ